MDCKHKNPCSTCPGVLHYFVLSDALITGTQYCGQWEVKDNAYPTKNKKKFDKFTMCLSYDWTSNMLNVTFFMKNVFYNFKKLTNTCFWKKSELTYFRELIITSPNNIQVSWSVCTKVNGISQPYVSGNICSSKCRVMIPAIVLS